MNGAVERAPDPLTTPASPDPVNVASRAALKKLPNPSPLFDVDPAVWESNVSVLSPSEFVFVCGRQDSNHRLQCLNYHKGRISLADNL